MVDPEGARYRPGDARGHYESWFIRGNHPSRPLAFWIRYTLTAPKGAPDEAIAELFAIAFDGERSRHVSVREAVSIRACTFSSSELDVRIEASHLTRERAVGRASSGGRTLGWELGWAGGGEPLLLLPERLYAAGFPKAKSLVIRPGVTFGGRLEIDGEPWPIDGWVGSINHNWGERHTDQYTWGQVAGFEGHPTTFIELATARIRIGPILTPAMTPIVVRHEGREYRLNALYKVFRRATIDGLSWSFAAKGDGIAVSGVISATPAQVVTFAYKNPPGGTKLCVNSKIARCELTITRDGASTTLVSQSGAAFEVLVDDVQAAERLGIAGLPPAQ